MIHDGCDQSEIFRVMAYLMSPIRSMRKESHLSASVGAVRDEWHRIVAEAKTQKCYDVQLHLVMSDVDSELKKMVTRQMAG